MDNLRLVLVFALALVLLLIYQAWIDDHPLEQPATSPTAQTTEPQAPPSTGTASVPPPTPSRETSQAFSESPTVAEPIEVQTDLLRIEISPRGGIITSVWLTDYPLSADDPTQKFRLMDPDSARLFVAQSGIDLNIDGPSLSTRDVVFHASASRFALADRRSSLTVELTSTVTKDVELVKRFTFERGSYVIAISQELRNSTGNVINARDFRELRRAEYTDPNAPRFVYTYTGAVYYSPGKKYTKVSFDDMKKEQLRLDVADGWIAMIQHYFLAAWIPPRGTQETFYSAVDGSQYSIGMASPVVSIAAGTSHSFSSRLYVGPKLQDVLSTLAPGLDLTADYGRLTVIAKPIHWLLAKIHGVVGNWGWSIIVLTILIKLAFFKLSETSYKSMAHLRQVAPRLQALKDRYGDDKERLNQAMMELYKTEKINPLGGCLPILVQIPFFIALYWVLLEAVELRQAPFILWIRDLSAPDPYFVLPLIMGVSMFIQQRLNPAPPDPMQAKLMMSLPFVFTVFFAFFPSGLVLYWTVNNALSIAQQWYITRAIEQAAGKRNR